MNDDELLRLWDAYHEVGHLVAGAAVGFEPGAASLNIDGRQITGCCFIKSFRVDRAAVVLAGATDMYFGWPGQIKSRMEGEIVTAMAGDVAVDLFAGGHVEPEANIVTTCHKVELPEPTDAELGTFTPRFEDDDAALKFPSDAEQISFRLRAAFGSADHAMALALRKYLDATTRVLLLRQEARIRWMATVLAEEGSLSARAVAKLLAEVQ